MIEEPTVEAIADALDEVLLDERLRAELKRLARQRKSAIAWEGATRQPLEVAGIVSYNRPL